MIDALRAIVGAQHVLTEEGHTQRYRMGFRFGVGRALAVVRPATLVEQWRVVQACVAADKIVIMQAANTGLTGGSTPDGNDYDREVVIVSTLRMKKAYVVADGKQVICFPGATLELLETMLAPLGREPHSVIGSSCIGASVFGGICNNSGGALVQRGPAYTEMAIYAQVDAQGDLQLVNHLGIRLGDVRDVRDAPEAVLDRLDRRDFTDADTDSHAGRGHDDGYASHVRDVDADTPARFNADPTRLHEASGSAGKLILFAVRLDTFPAECGAAVFYVGTDRIDTLTELRRHMLGNATALPIAGEYMHRDAFDLADQYGKDSFLAIRLLGTRRMPALFALKGRCDALLRNRKFLPSNVADRVLQAVSHLFPDHLPRRMRTFRDRYPHHLLLKVAEPQIEATRKYLDGLLGDGARGGYFRCTPKEGDKAFLHRFAAAGAAGRYRALHEQEIEGMVALDIALRRNDRQWFESLPPEVGDKLTHRIYYGHFFCHVFHQDYIVKKGHAVLDVEHAMWKLLDTRGAQYPAEHNVGHLYDAKPALKAFYRGLDPRNQFNPGIGHTSKLKDWS